MKVIIMFGVLCFVNCQLSAMDAEHKRARLEAKAASHRRVIDGKQAWCEAIAQQEQGRKARELEVSIVINEICDERDLLACLHARLKTLEPAYVAELEARCLELQAEIDECDCVRRALEGVCWKCSDLKKELEGVHLELQAFGVLLGLDIESVRLSM